MINVMVASASFPDVGPNCFLDAPGHHVETPNVTAQHPQNNQTTDHVGR